MSSVENFTKHVKCYVNRNTVYAFKAFFEGSKILLNGAVLCKKGP